MSQSGTFRKQARQARQVFLEDSYAHGMASGDRLLDSGFVKYLVNYTLEDKGTKLAPRRGLHARLSKDQGVPAVADGYDLFFGADASDKGADIPEQRKLGELLDNNAYYGDLENLQVGQIYPTHNFADIRKEVIQAFDPETGLWTPVTKYIPYNWKIKNVFLSYTDTLAFTETEVDTGVQKNVLQCCMETTDAPVTKYATPDGNIGTYKTLDLLHHFRYFTEDDEGLQLLKYDIKSLIPYIVSKGTTSGVLLTNRPKYVGFSTRLFTGPDNGLRVHDGFENPFRCVPHTLNCTLQNQFIGLGTWKYTVAQGFAPAFPNSSKGYTYNTDMFYTVDILKERIGEASFSHANKNWPEPLASPFNSAYNLPETDLIPETKNYINTTPNIKESKDYAVCLRPLFPMELDAGFAGKYGYNMLLKNPYAFKNNLYMPPAFTLYGCLPRDPSNGKLRLDYREGEHIHFALNFAESSEDISQGVSIKTEYRIGNDDSWYPANYIYDKGTGVNISGYGMLTLNPAEQLKEFVIPLRVPASSFMIRISVSRTAAAEAVITENVYSFRAGRGKISAAATRLKNYELTDAQGMLSWKNRVVLWGVPDAPNLMFTSDINNPRYFPFPNGVEEYPDPVLHVVNFLDKLLVFTTNGIYETALDDDGLAYTTKQVVGDVHLSQADIPAICPVKNMLFYKVGNYYYMLVPSTKYNTLGQLQTAPISQPIEYFLDHFEVELRKVLQALYGGLSVERAYSFEDPQRFKITPTNYSCFLDGDIVKVNYGFHLENPLVNFAADIIFCLKYDTLVRAWSIDIYEVQPENTIAIYKKNIVGYSEYIVASNNPPANSSEDYSINVALFECSPHTCVDELGGRLPTVQLLDTGYRDIGAVNNKRYREIQLKINNKTDEALEFSSEFYADNVRRKKLHDYIVSADPITNNIIITPLPEPTPSPGVTTLEEPNTGDPPSPPQPVETSNKYWRLSQEFLSRDVLNTLRIKVSGKGYAPRMILLSQNETPYELHGFGWVFRNMNAR